MNDKVLKENGEGVRFALVKALKTYSIEVPPQTYIR